MEGGETFTCSAALAIEPASPTATKYSSCLSVKRSGMGCYDARLVAAIKPGPLLAVEEGLIAKMDRGRLADPVLIAELTHVRSRTGGLFVTGNAVARRVGRVEGAGDVRIELRLVDVPQCGQLLVWVGFGFVVLLFGVWFGFFVFLFFV